MDDRTTETALSLTKFGVGQPVRRSEDPKLVRGEGCYTDDLSRAGQAYAVMVRSRDAHGTIRSIDTAAAKAMPGVLAVCTAADLSAYGPLKCNLPLKNRDGSPMRYTPRPALAGDKVRFVGDPVACVVAETVAQAKDAAEAVTVDVEPLPVVLKPADAVKPGASLVFDAVPNNIALDFHYGDAAKVAEAFARAKHVTRLETSNQRMVVNAMEPRSAIGEYNKTDSKWTLYSSSQGVHGMKTSLMDILNSPAEKVRVVTGQVGGSFGMKASVYPEYVCILHAARLLGRPVKWTDERSGSFVSDHHGRAQDMVMEIAFDETAHILAIRLTGYGDMGGYLAAFGPLLPTGNQVKNITSVYRTPLIEVATKCVFTNTNFVSAYRGAGRPEGNYYVERTLDLAANELGIDRVELRKRNMIRKSDLPFKSASEMTYDCGDFLGVLKKALEAADYAGFNKRKRESKKRGLLRGLGIGCYLEVTAAPGKELGAIHFEADGTVTIITGTLDFGMGHATTYAQILSDLLGVPFDRIRMVEGDSDRMAFGGGSGGSRSVMFVSTALSESATIVIDRGKQIASHVLEASARDIEFKAGRFIIAGTDRSIGLLDVAARLRGGLKLPDGVPNSLDVDHVVKDPVPSAFPNGCHIAEVEVDPETGAANVVRYTAVNDLGTIVNPLLVEGQIQGGVVQGLGQVLLEEAVYDSDGQLVTGSFMDYAMPRAHDAPMINIVSHPVPTKSNPLGAKGCGEAGTSGGLPSVANAVIDALSEYNIRHLEMPMTPARIWQAIQAAKARPVS
ncbi:MAG TPA: xanthine dehydrogenase family protein molybdopterin-binding subunit [Pseudolabrys sp.]|jgi:carbon-monoxide dehydrogenase large subunit|nr:xanthine dehydrogenase family protein molybdopterin-binding subunit [Pseudolabrys sp.]